MKFTQKYETKTKLLEEFSKPYIGNEVLYSLCERYPIAKDIDWNPLSSQIWLIGRSYSASPERRKYTNKRNIFENSGDGLDTFFHNLSKTIIKQNNWNEFCAQLDEIKEKEYLFDVNNFDQDLELLSKVINIVYALNRIIRSATYVVDFGNENFGDDDLPNNKISFCTKFLHFHFKNIFFIMDSISEKHFKKLKGKYIFNYNNLKFDDIAEEFNKNYGKIYDKINKKFGGDYKRYAKHCINEYVLAYVLKSSGYYDNICEKVSITRYVDTFIMNMNKK